VEPRIGYNYPIRRTVTSIIFIINTVLIGDVFFLYTAGLANMVRTYKRKTLPHSYFKEGLNTAVENVKSGRMTLYRVSQEEGTKLRESVPYVKIYRYNPKHL